MVFRQSATEVNMDIERNQESLQVAPLSKVKGVPCVKEKKYC
jgi:hypothetical protein